jgi:hypothetical protein
MNKQQAKKMLKAKLECLKRETSGTNFDCNNSNCDECSLCYEQGNMGEQKEALDMAIKALEQQPCEDTISRQAPSWYAAQIEKLPAAQPEIIRCKDCKYARLTNDGSCKYCDIWFPNEAEYMDGNYYCASAERKTDG